MNNEASTEQTTSNSTNNTIGRICPHCGAVIPLCQEHHCLTPSEIDAILREAGYNPDEIGAQMKAAAERALRNYLRDNRNDGHYATK